MLTGNLSDDNHVVELMLEVLLLGARADLVEEFLRQSSLTSEKVQEVGDI